METVKHMKQKIGQRNCFISILLSSALIMLLPPTDANRISVNKFERFIGLGIANNWNVSKVVRNFYCWFLLFIVSAVLFLFILEYLQRRDPQIRERKSWQLLNGSALSAFVVILFRMFAFFWRLNSFSFGYFLILSIFILDVIYCYGGLEKRVDVEKYTLIKMVSMSLGFTAAVINPGQRNDGHDWLIYFYIIFGILFIVYYLYQIRNRGLQLPCENVIGKICTLFLGLPFLTSVYIELVNILNQYNVFIRKPRRVYCVALVAFGCVVLLISFLRRNRVIKWKRGGYPLFLLGLGCLACQIPLQQQVTPDLFESANASVLISDFLHFGKIPIIEHYGGHMLKDVVGGIAYAFINQDSSGAVLRPYSGLIYVVNVLIFYFFLKELLQNEDSAFLYTLCLPFGGIAGYYMCGILICISVGSYIKKHGYGKALIIWISCAIAVLQRLDVGTAFGIATVIGLGVYLLKSRQVRYLKELGLTFLTVILSGMATWTILCMIKNCSPIERIREFVAISLSNQNWGTGLLGDKYSIYFAFAYMFIPVICAVLLFYFLFLMDAKQKECASYYMVIILGMAYFANLPRGLVRHTLNELATNTVVFSGGLFIVAALYYIYKKEMSFISGSVALIILLSFMAGQDNFTEEPLIEKVPVKVNKCIGGWSSEWQNITERKPRVQIPEDMEETIASYQNVFELLLDEDDTYLDFMNVSFLYSALGRECPVYVAQSPGHLSGEYTQEAFIRQIEEKKEKIPLAILPATDAAEDMTSVDGIANISRYYKVSEYIYQNYRPLCRIKNTAVWCRLEEYDALADRLEQKYELIDYGYDQGDVQYLHDYPMYDIPYLWGNYDTKAAWTNPVLADIYCKGEGQYYMEEPLQIDKSKGNYLLLTCRCENEYMEETNNAEIILGSTKAGEEDLFRFRFKLHPGEQQYLIRISADYYWYVQDIDMLYLHTDEEIGDVRMQILQGD